jgi:Flp pilus assembly protein TadD
VRPLVITLLVAASGLKGVEAPPQALVLEAPAGARIVRNGEEKDLALPPGELLYAGDEISTLRREAVIAHCASGKVFVLEARSHATIAATGVTPLQGRVRESGGEDCVLPLVPVLKADENHRSVWDRLPLPPLPPAAAGLTPLARLRKAVTAAAAGRYEEALAEYVELRDRHYPDAPWLKARVFQHREDLPPPLQRSGGSGRTFAIVVGISQYRSPAITPLRYAHLDAQEFAEFLASPRGGGVSNIQLLTQSQADTRRIREAIDRVAASGLRAADTVILYFACHAGPDKKNGDLHVVTYDANPENLRDSALAFDYLRRVLTSRWSQAARIQVYLDVCRAGHLGVAPSAPGPAYAAAENSRRLNPRLFLALAAGPDEFAWEDEGFGGGHGAFTFCLLRGLNEGKADRNADGTVNGGEIVRYLVNEVPDEVARMQQRLRQGSAGARSARTRPAQQQQPRFSGDYLNSEILSWLSRPGPRTRLVPATPGRAGGRRSFELEGEGDAVIRDYLEGEDSPPRVEDFERAAGAYEQARRDAPYSLRLESRELFCRGRLAIFKKRYDEAVAEIEQAVALDPTAAFAYNALGIAHLERAEFDLARKAFDDTIRRAPYWSYAWHNLALTHIQRGDYAEAERTYRKAVELAPQRAYLHHNLGLLYQNMNRRGEAAREFLRAIELLPARPESHSALGALRAMEGRSKEAERWLRKAVELAPQEAEARHNLALAVQRQGRKRIQEAERLLRANLDLHPAYAPSRLALARLLAAAGRKAEAIAEYRKLPAENAAWRAELEKLQKKRGR